MKETKQFCVDYVVSTHQIRNARPDFLQYIQSYLKRQLAERLTEELIPGKEYIVRIDEDSHEFNEMPQDRRYSYLLTLQQR